MQVALQHLKVQEGRYQEYKDGFVTAIQECVQTLQMIDCITDRITCEVNIMENEIHLHRILEYERRNWEETESE